MKLTFKIGTTIAVLGLLALSFWVGGCKHRKEADSLNTALYKASGTIVENNIKIRGLEVAVFKSDAQVVSSQKAIKQLKEEKEYLRKLHITDVKSISNLIAEIEVLERDGWYRDTIIIRDTITKVIDTVRTASWNDNYAWCKVMLYPNKPVFSLGLSDVKLKVFVGNEGLFSNKPVAVVTTTNPYVKISSANTVVVDADNKFLSKKYPYIILGGVLGFLIAK